MTVKKKNISYLLVFLLTIFLSYIIANREVGIIGDTKTYTNTFLHGSACKCMGDSDIGFEYFLYPMYILSFTPPQIFFVISLTIHILIFISSIKIFNAYTLSKNIIHKHKYYIALFSLCIMVPIVYQVHTNAIRQGLSSLLLLIAFLYQQESQLKKMFVFLVLSVTFHISAILIVPFFLLFFFSRLKISASFSLSILILFSFVFLYVLGFSENTVKFISNFFGLPIWELVSTYGSDSSYKAGIRYDFVAYTLFIMLPIFIYALYNRKAKSYFVFIAISTIPFLILGWGAYSNRYLFNVWIYIPFGLLGLLIARLRFIREFHIVLFFLAFFINLIYLQV